MGRFSLADRFRTLAAPCIACGLLLIVLCALPVANVAGPIDESLATPRVVRDVAGRLRYPALDLRRDPFVQNGDVPVVQGSLEDAVAGIVLPANAGASASARPVVRGVLLGPHPSALIETAGHVTLVRPGTPLLGSMVSKIDATGVVLEDGEALQFAGKRR